METLSTIFFCIVLPIGIVMIVGSLFEQAEKKQPKSSIDRMCDEISAARRDNNYNTFSNAAREEEKLKYDRERFK